MISRECNKPIKRKYSSMKTYWPNKGFLYFIIRTTNPHKLLASCSMSLKMFVKIAPYVTARLVWQHVFFFKFYRAGEKKAVIFYL